MGTDENGVIVACGTGAISIESCQPENKKPVAAVDWMNGYQVKTGESLGGEKI